MIGLLRRGDDGLTDRQRRRLSDEYERTLGATPPAETFARARARYLTSLLTSPQQGHNAAGEVAALLTGASCEAASSACTTSHGTPLVVVGPGGRGEAGAGMPVPVPCLACGADSAPGDDLCGSHGGMTDGIARHDAMRSALTT